MATADLRAHTEPPPYWMQLLRLYGRFFPIKRGKARIAKAAFRRFPLPRRPVVAPIECGVHVELWPWIWADFCLYAFGGPELFVLDYFRTLLNERSTVLDVGAYLGAYSLLAAKIAVHGEVHAFEPDPRTAERLARALAANEMSRVRLCQCAVGARSERRQLSLAAYPPQSAIQGTATPAIQEQVSVSQVSLDRYCDDNRLTGVDVIKIDTEGNELPVLQGAARIISSVRPILIVELHEQESLVLGHSVAETLAYMRDRAYALFRVSPGWFRPRLQPFTFRPGEGRAIVVARPAPLS